MVRSLADRTVQLGEGPERQRDEVLLPVLAASDGDGRRARGNGRVREGPEREAVEGETRLSV